MGYWGWKITELSELESECCLYHRDPIAEPKHESGLLECVYLHSS